MQYRRCRTGVLAMALLAVAVLSGCRQRTLSWQSTDPARVASTQTIAVVQPHYSPVDGPGWQLASAVANDIAGELMKRNYRVKFIGLTIQAPLRTNGNVEIEIDPEQPTTQPAANPVDVIAQAREIGAELLCEVFLEVTPHVNVSPMYGPPYGTFGVYMSSGGTYYGAWPRRYPWSWPYYYDDYDVSYSLLVGAASLRLVTVHEGDLLATVKVQYDTREDDASDIAADLMMGIDAIRQGRPEGDIELKTRPGEWPDEDEDDKSGDNRDDEDDVKSGE